MIEFAYLFAGASIIAVIMVLCALRTVGRVWIYRGVMIVLFALFMPVAYFGFGSLPGTSRSIDQGSLKTYHGESQVVGFYAINKLGIFLLVMVDGEKAPAVYFRLPWDERAMDQLQRAAQQAEAEGQPLMANMDALAKLARDAQGERQGEGDGDGSGSGNGAQQGAEGQQGDQSGTGAGWDAMSTAFYAERPQPTRERRKSDATVTYQIDESGAVTTSRMSNQQETPPITTQNARHPHGAYP